MEGWIPGNEGRIPGNGAGFQEMRRGVLVSGGEKQKGKEEKRKRKKKKEKEKEENLPIERRVTVK